MKTMDIVKKLYTAGLEAKRTAKRTIDLRCAGHYVGTVLVVRDKELCTLAGADQVYILLCPNTEISWIWGLTFNSIEGLNAHLSTTSTTTKKPL